MAFRETHGSSRMPAVLALGAMLGLVGLAGCGGQSRDGGGARTAGSAGATADSLAASAFAPESAAATSGAQLFQRCATCHQATGLGLPGAFPPLAGSEWANALDPAVPIRIVLHGLAGPITVAHQRFNSAMPPYGTNQPMDDSTVAAVLTYVRSSWGDKAGAVTAAQVAAQRMATASRTTQWTSKELEPLMAAGGGGGGH